MFVEMPSFCVYFPNFGSLIILSPKFTEYEKESPNISWYYEMHHCHIMLFNKYLFSSPIQEINFVIVRTTGQIYRFVVN